MLRSHFHILIALLFASFTPCMSQVWPGDVDNNGQVNNVDLLYLGHAFGAVGPIRPSAASTWEEQPILADWGEFFPDGVNYAYADCDGSGLIDFMDVAVAFANMGRQHDVVQGLDFQYGIFGVDPAFKLDDADLPQKITSLSEFYVPIILGEENLPVENFNGIAFTLSFDPELVQEFRVEVTADWLQDSIMNSDLFHAQTQPDSLGKVQLALSKFGRDPQTGFGEIARAYIVIEEDLLDRVVDSTNTGIVLEDVMLINENFDVIPVAADSLTMMVYNPDFVSVSSEPLPSFLRIFPNPADQKLTISSDRKLGQTALLNSLGQVVWQRNMAFENDIQIDVAGLSGGMYWLRFLTQEGMISRKIVIRKAE